MSEGCRPSLHLLGDKQVVNDIGLLLETLGLLQVLDELVDVDVAVVRGQPLAVDLGRRLGAALARVPRPTAQVLHVMHL